MAGYLIRRLATALVVVLGITLVTFLMLHIVAPDPGLTILPPKTPPAAIRAYDHLHGYDRPWFQQFVSYLNQLVHGNLGFSDKDNQSVLSLFREKAPLSAFLSGVSLLVAILVALPLGIYQAVRRNRIGDVAATTVAFILYSMPVFMVALILIQVFALSLNWVDPNVSQDQTLSGALSSWPELVLPVVALSSTTVAAYSRYQRSASLDVLAQDYIKVAKAKGLPDRLIYARHLVRNASLPMITLIGLSLPILIAGNVLIESVFNIDGLGLLFIKSLQANDYNVLLGYTLLTAILTVIGNLIADVALTVSDPRIRLV